MLGWQPVFGHARGFLVIFVLVLPVAATGCNADPTFCELVRQPQSAYRVGNDTDANHRRQIRALNEIVAALHEGPTRQDMMVVRDYAEVLFGTKQYGSAADKEAAQLKVTQQFFEGASQRLDRRLRDECKIDLGDDASPFGLLTAQES